MTETDFLLLFAPRLQHSVLTEFCVRPGHATKLLDKQDLAFFVVLADETTGNLFAFGNLDNFFAGAVWHHITQHSKVINKSNLCNISFSYIYFLIVRYL